MPLWIDTHCHLDAPELAGLPPVQPGDAAGADVLAPEPLAQLHAMRQQARAAGVGHCVLPAVERANWATVRTLAQHWGDSYALGIHPLFTPHAQDADLEHLADALAQHHACPHLVAVGEIGLDYFVPGLDPLRQLHYYRAQLRLARRFDLPVILHVRRSADALLKALRELPVCGGIAHAFNGSMQQAQTFVAMGFKLGFGGAVTFDRALQLRRLAAQLPADAIVLETDAPDIPPHWLYATAAQRAAGQRMPCNTPAQLPRIAQVVAQLRGQDASALAQATSANACAALPRLAALLR